MNTTLLFLLNKERDRLKGLEILVVTLFLLEEALLFTLYFVDAYMLLLLASCVSYN